MLKISTKILLCLLLVMHFDVVYIVSVILAFLAGISITTGSEIIKNGFSWKKFGVRLMYSFGLMTIGGIYWYNEGKSKETFLYFVIVVVLFSDTIITLGFRVGKNLLNKYAKNIENE